MDEPRLTTGVFSSRTDEWATPKATFDELDREFNFTLDPCATTENAKCAKFFTVEDDGLAQSWSGERVFCNPPYSDIKKWVQKCYIESRDGTLIVLLMPARTDTAAFHDYIYSKAEVRFLRGRLKFGDGKNSAPFPSMVVVFGGL
jgi:phage N-6-adenine-methyltransferase